jgi:hypothetical protein
LGAFNKGYSPKKLRPRAGNSLVFLRRTGHTLSFGVIDAADNERERGVEEEEADDEEELSEEDEVGEHTGTEKEEEEEEEEVEKEEEESIGGVLST